MALEFDQGEEVRHSDDVQDIITAVPSWILRWGITIFFIILAMLIGLTALISYPDIVKAPLKIVSPDTSVTILRPDSGDVNFLGEMTISQHSIDKVKEGQLVLVKLHSFPFEKYGILKGKIDYLSEMPGNDGMYRSTITFSVTNRSDQNIPINIKKGMTADADIITQDATIFDRLLWNLINTIGYK